MKFISKSLIETKKFAKILLNNKTKFYCFNGDLGTGKTTIIKFMAKQLGEKKIVTSPSFTKMKIYQKFVHIDAYNMVGNLEKFEEYFENKIVLIEWFNNLEEKIDNAIIINTSKNSQEQYVFEIEESK